MADPRHTTAKFTDETPNQPGAHGGGDLTEGAQGHSTTMSGNLTEGRPDGREDQVEVEKNWSANNSQNAGEKQNG